ncbi:MAG: hypothetical protein O3A95_08680 [Planctomycetota bacterium]|nr:hypothetical protein [Planctomycetota bacterium]
MPRLVLPLLFACLFSAPIAAQLDPNAPDKREQKKLMEEYRELDKRDVDGFARRVEIVNRLESVKLERPADIKKWRKDLAAADAKYGRKLEEKSGRHYYFDDPKTGLFILGGDTKNPKGLVICMHGGGVGSGDANGMVSSMSSPANELDWLAIFPEVLEKTERGWTDDGTEEWVVDLIDGALRTWKIDPNRVYLSGHSMGGYGSWTLGAHHADRVAALAPSAGAPTPAYGPDGTIVEVDQGVVPNLRNVPMIVFQSTDDPRVPPDANQAAVKDVEKFKDLYGGYENFTYWEVEDRQHQFPVGSMKVLMEKMDVFERQPIQDKIVWQPTLDWKHQMGWLWWEAPVMTLITVAERLPDSNTIAIESKADLSTLYVLLDERVVDMEKEVIITVNGEETNRGLPQPTLGTMLLTGSTPDQELLFLARMKVLK